MIRLLSGLAVLLVTGPGLGATPIEFDATVTTYEEERFEPARTSFRRMAEAGVPEAQFNLGVMTLNGQGGAADRAEAALWIRLSADAGYQPAMEAVDVMMKHLDDEQRSEYDQRLPDWQDRYARRSLIERHQPETCESSCLERDENELPSSDETRKAEDESSDSEEITTTVNSKELVVKQRMQPHYPRDAADSGTMGRVVLGAWLDDNGTLQHPHIIEQHPDDVFGEAAMKAFKRWQFEWPEGVPASAPKYMTQEIVFTLDSLSRGNQPNGGKTQRELQSAVEEGESDLEAAHKAVWLVERLQLPVPEQAKRDSVVSVIFQAAQAGVSRAQRDLADRLVAGDLVQQDREAAIFWLKQAAFEGDVIAQFELASGDWIPEDFRRDLRRAAALDGFLPALLWELREQVASPDSADRQYLEALLDRLPDEWSHGDELIEKARQLAEA